MALHPQSLQAAHDAPELAGEVSAAPTTGLESKTCVIDTCVLVADPEVLTALPDSHLVIPLTVVEELDGLKTRSDEIGWAAREAVRILEGMRTASGGLRDPHPTAGSGSVRVQVNGMHEDALVAVGLDPARADNRILGVTAGLAKARPTVLVTNDAAMRLKADQLGLVSVPYERAGASTPISARPQHVDVTAEAMEWFYAERGGVDVDELGLQPDVGPLVVLHGPSGGSALARRVEDRLVHLHRAEAGAWGLRPRSTEQRFALDVLMDPAIEVVVLSGPAGTGKTLLALAAGLEQTVEGRLYEQVGVYRPIVEVGHHSLGFLPGDLDDKLAEWVRPVTDALAALTDGGDRKVAVDVRDELVAKNKLEFGSIAHIRGRSLTSSWLIVDELQNVEPATIRVMLSRVAAGTKAILVGDTSQVDNPYLSSRSNGLSSVVAAFSGQPWFAHVELVKGERSRVASMAAEML